MKKTGGKSGKRLKARDLSAKKSGKDPRGGSFAAVINPCARGGIINPCVKTPRGGIAAGGRKGIIQPCV
jgi:hypothetical protein